MKTNELLQKQVQDAMKWEPFLKQEKIVVEVNDGVVTLSGTVDNFAKKLEAESAAKKVSGVRAVVEKLEVHMIKPSERQSDEMAHQILNAFKWNCEIPGDSIKVTVEKCWVYLEGSVEWNYQREAAAKAVRNLVGVMGVNNNIVILSPSKDNIEKEAIDLALVRNTAVDDDNVVVNVFGNKVTLTGTVNSWFQKEEAGRMAWNAPGVREIVNNIHVDAEFNDLSKGLKKTNRSL